MRKNFGPKPYLFPMPVLMVAAYDAEGTPDVMNAAWGAISAHDKVALFIDENHKTTAYIRETGAFTVSLADRAHMAEADYFGIATGNKMPDKFARSGFHATKSEFVNAPVIEEFPLALECELVEIIDTDTMHAVVGRIVNASAKEEVLAENGKPDPVKLDALTFDQFQSGYYAVGERVGQAWNAGMPLMKDSQ